MYTSEAFAGPEAPPPSPFRRQERCHCRLRRSRIVQGTAAAEPEEGPDSPALPWTIRDAAPAK